MNNVVPDGLEDKAISLKELAGEDIEVDGLLREILREFRKYYSMFRKNGISSVRPGYGRLSVLLGRRVEVKDGEKTIRGTAKDISCDGALIVRTDKTEHKIFSGDVTEVKGD